MIKKNIYKLLELIDAYLIQILSEVHQSFVGVFPALSHGILVGGLQILFKMIVFLQILQCRYADHMSNCLFEWIDQLAFV